MTERRKLSLGDVTETDRPREKATAAWNVSAARQQTLKDRARDMRRNPTAAQKALWAQLRDKKCGFTFEREVVMGSAIVDFACKTRWLVVETGGDSETETTLAALSDRKLTDVGVRVLRFADEQVLNDPDAVVAEIKAELQKPFERPRAAGGR